jgi:hypothetical protein
MTPGLRVRVEQRENHLILVFCKRIGEQYDEDGKLMDFECDSLEVGRLDQRAVLEERASKIGKLVISLIFTNGLQPGDISLVGRGHGN